MANSLQTYTILQKQSNGNSNTDCKAKLLNIITALGPLLLRRNVYCFLINQVF